MSNYHHLPLQSVAYASKVLLAHLFYKKLAVILIITVMYAFDINLGNVLCMPKAQGLQARRRRTYISGKSQVPMYVTANFYITLPSGR